MGEAHSLREMISNLVDNALQYTQAGGQVTVEVSQDAKQAILIVSDNGPGIPEAERDRVFERFYRIAENRTFGSGLGLSIVQEIANAHQASIVVHSGKNDIGTLIQVSFKLAP
jgi:two-component system sensor histidine kinase TctE